MLILHIPHSSTVIPFHEGYALPEKDLNEEINRLTDWYTEDLFDTTEDKKIIAPFSRIFCDVERFPDDTIEIMAKYGMGMLYEKTDDGRKMRTISEELRKKVLNEYYSVHHRKLDDAVEEDLESEGKAVIIDCHSFPNIPMIRDLDQDSNRPDINIGTDDFHTPPWLEELSIRYFAEKGYSVLVNKPYAGSIVPMKYFRKNKMVMSIMIEVNRKLYLSPGSSCRNENYMKIKELISNYLNKIRDWND